MADLLNAKERERLERLRRRSDFLLERISRPDGPERWWDVAERSALVWAIDAIEALKAGTYQPPKVDPRPSAMERAERRAAAVQTTGPGSITSPGPSVPPAKGPGGVR
jgi:hypothetical protein